MAGRDRQLVNRMLEYCHEIAGTLTYFGGDEQRFFADLSCAMPWLCRSSRSVNWRPM